MKALGVVLSLLIVVVFILAIYVIGYESGVRAVQADAALKGYGVYVGGFEAPKFFRWKGESCPACKGTGLEAQK